jgi:uncharacterized protein (TIGR02466 family)
MNSNLPDDDSYNLAVDWMFHPRFVVAPMHLRLDQQVFEDFVRIADIEIANPARQPYDHRLAGIIRQGEQIEATPRFTPKLRRFIEELAHHYVLRLADANGVKIRPTLQTEFRDGWIVLSRAGDYNPVHKHDAQLSGIVYVRVPPQVAEPTTMDGKLHFLFGQQQERNLDFLGNRMIVPREGDFYLFPAWMQHVVYPFQGPGERVSIAFNLLAHNVSAS